MVAFLAALAVMVGMSFGAAFILEGVQKPSSESFRTSSVRINPEDGLPPVSHANKKH
jgi:hypothetical protein